MVWYSVSLRFANLVGSEGISGFWDSVFLVVAEDRADAIREARQMGRSREELYANAQAEQVRRAFLGVITVDELGESLANGVEVWFAPTDFVRPIPIGVDVDFSPDSIEPGNAGIGIETP
ncbi:MAG: DUF4288 domain-containing protein [Acidimicrobiales bacterium]